MKKKILGLALIAVLAFSLAACKNQTDQTVTGEDTSVKTVRLGFPGASNFIFGLGGIAQEKKFFDEELEKIGYKLEYVPFAAAGPAVNEALAGKQIDIAIYADFPGVVLKSKGVNIDLVGITENKFHSMIVVKNDSSIKSAAELKGKKIGFTKGTYMHKNLLEILAANGLSADDVELVNVTSDAESALVSGNVDAIVQTQTDSLIIANTKKTGTILESTKNYPNLSAQVIFVGVHDYVEKNPDVAIAVNKALLRAKKFMKENPQEAYQILTKSGLNLDSVKELYADEAPEFDLFTIGISEDSARKLEVTQSFLLEEGLITEGFDTSKWIDNSYYEKAAEEFEGI